LTGNLTREFEGKKKELVKLQEKEERPIRDVRRTTKENFLLIMDNRKSMKKLNRPWNKLLLQRSKRKMQEMK